MLLAENTLVDGRYRILHRIGSGGMADVWCARDTQLERKVALKILHRRFAQDREFVERFRREASAAAGLQHPNVVNVFDRGEFDGTYYIAMEYVEGSSLKDVIATGVSVSEAVGITRQILAAARFAHSHGVIHRDFKPQNVLVDGEGRATVTDFGIARAGASEITQTGSVMGTAHYLSPEQAQGLEVSGASDLYSIGVVLFEMLTGRVPFEADSAVAVALKQVSETPRPPSELNPKVPRALDAVVLKTLAKDPQNRFASADELLEALDQAEAQPTVAPVDTAAFAPVHAPERTEVRGAPVEGPPGEPPPAERGPRRWRWRWVFLGALLLALVALAVWALTRAGTEVVPAVLGQQEDQARAILERAGFEVSTDAVQSEAKSGTVLEQDPRAGTSAEEGSTVTLTVSAGPGTAKIPKVAGLAEDEAVKKLERAGFEVDTEQRFSNQLAAGQAIGTEPSAGTEVRRGSTVTLLVSAGSNLVEVPSVLGQQEEIAESQLERAGFIVNAETRESSEAKGTVIVQDPAGGSLLRRGGTVTIVVSRGPTMVAVPGVEGLSRAEASAELRSAGLGVAVRQEEVSSPDDDGVVIDQDPRPGTRVEEGSTVTIVVGHFIEVEAPLPEPLPEPPSPPE